MGVLMEHTQDVKCVAWHPTEEVNHIAQPSPQTKHSDASLHSIDFSVRLIRRYDQALPRRSKRGLVLFFHAHGPFLDRMVSRMVTERPVPRIRIGRLYHPDLEAYHETRVGMRAGVAGRARPDGVLGNMGPRKTRHDYTDRRRRVSRLGRFDRGRWQNQCLGV